MSCFEGRVKELKNVSIDCFENSNIYSTTYFLSHCHAGIYICNANILYCLKKLIFRSVCGVCIQRSGLWFARLSQNKFSVTYELI